MINTVIDDIKTIVEAYAGIPELPSMAFYAIEQFDLHLESLYPCTVAYAQLSSVQPYANLRGYDVSIVSLDKMPIREVGETDNVFQKRVYDLQELLKRFIQNVVVNMTTLSLNFQYSLTNDIINFESQEQYLEWDLVGVIATFNVTVNVSEFICDMPFNF